MSEPTVILDHGRPWNYLEPEPPPQGELDKNLLVKVGAAVLAVTAFTVVVAVSNLGADANSASDTPGPTATAPANPDPTSPDPTTAPTESVGVTASAGATAPAPATPNRYRLTATVLNPDQVTIVWQSDETDVTGWNVARDGTDDTGYGPWNTDLPATARTHTFNILVAGFDYTFTLTPSTAKGSGPPATVKANTAKPDGPRTGPSSTAGPTKPPSPGTGSGATAAARFGWGTPLPASDEFNYTGAPDSAKWSTIAGCGPGHVGNGRRCGANSQVNGSALVQTGTAGGDTGWMASRFNQKYGRWEARVRSMNTGAANGREYHPLLIIWPDREDWPRSGEYDFLENGAPGQACAEAFIHYPHPPGAVQQEYVKETNCGAPLSEWHNVAIDWQASGITGYIDGVRWFSFSGGGGSGGRSDIQAMPNGHLTIQLDNFFGSGLTPARYEIDWVRIYAP